MQQLTLQFDGYADSHLPVDVCSTKQSSCEAISGLLSQCVAFISKKAEPLKTLAAATAAVAFGFSIIFLSAIIGG